MLLLLTRDHHGREGGYFVIAIVSPRSSQLPACCYLCVTIAIVGSRFGCSCCCYYGVLVGTLRSSGSWREGHHGGHVVDDAKGLLPVCVLLLCCLRVTIFISISGSRSGCSCCGVLIALGRKSIMVTNMLIEDMLTLLMLLKDC